MSISGTVSLTEKATLDQIRDNEKELAGIIHKMTALQGRYSRIREINDKLGERLERIKSGA